MQYHSDIKVQSSSRDLVYRNGTVAVPCHFGTVVRIINFTFEFLQCSSLLLNFLQRSFQAANSMEQSPCLVQRFQASYETL